ncbi:hypothetical protein VB711_13350 [Cronbergia sp. UHCC 0137]|uniref:hypothetical protein n=1 Tax=Cronbergia sp. UHCC 0137 TaxID=3110239 RepID=UPI002B2085A5|nr:hypothetical protein [Cronbergia sp. UHCC 0137]MEA5618817.1 hypothetical protein [Cronbergia sp. UHCC 0137]
MLIGVNLGSIRFPTAVLLHPLIPSPQGYGVHTSPVNIKSAVRNRNYIDMARSGFP